MKSRLFLVTFLLVLWGGVTFGQGRGTEKRITASFSGIPLSEAIGTIEKTSGYTFFYDAKKTDLTQKVSLSARNMPIAEAISSMLKTTNLGFEIANMQVVLFLKEKKPAAPQSKEIDATGKVTDHEGNPLVGVTVVTETGNRGTTTGNDGRFFIRVPQGAYLIFSYLGYENQTLKAVLGMSVTLKEDSKSMEAVVVVGYGTQKKANLLGAVSQVTSEELKDRPVSSLGKALQGVIPNLNITYGSGLPGAETNLNIRGVASINGSGAPLVLIDGIEGNIDRVNPNDVESVSVLKDAASAAIYGARAGFGVILITTKNNADGKMRINYSGRFSVSDPTTCTDFITTGYDAAVLADEFNKSYNGSPYTRYDGDDFRQLYQRRNDRTENPDRPWVVQKNGKYMYYANFNWYDYLFDYTQPTWDHDLSISGGNEKFNYLVSGNHYTKEGLYAQNTDKYTTNNLNMKFGAQVKPWLSINGAARLFHSNYRSPGYDFEDGGNIPNYTFHAMPFVTPYNPDGSSVYTTEVTGSAPADGMAAAVTQGKAFSQLKQTQYTTTIGGVITPLKGWSIVGTFSYKRYHREKTFRSANITYSDAYGEMKTATTGFFSDKLRENSAVEEHYTYDLYTTYEHSVNRHNFKVLAGMNHEAYRYKLIYGAKSSLQSDYLNDLNLGTGVAEASGGQSRWALLGFFGRGTYDYAGKYLAEVNFRWDGSSRFPKHDRWGFSPSVALGWRISEENFMEPVRKVIDNVKLRASIGSLGNQAIADSYPYIQSLSPSLSTSYLMNGNKIYITSLGAPQSGDLTWETIITKNLGLDLGFFGNRLTATADFYIRDTKDMLIPGKELPGVYGMASPNMNAGDLRTRGYEITLGWQDRFNLCKKPFSYNVSLTLADSKAKITKFDNPTNSLRTYIVGRDVGEIWGYHIEGLFRTDAEAANRKIDQSFVNPNIYNEAVGAYRGLQAGDLIYADLDDSGAVDYGDYTSDDPGDLRVIGNSRPRYHYSINAGFTWYGFDFSVFFQGIGRQHIYPGANNMLFWGPYARPYSSFIPTTFLTDVWTEDTPDAYYPKARGYAAQGSRSLAQTNDRYLQNLAYCRLKNLTFGYTLPSSLTSKIRVEKIRVYFSGDNLFTWTKLKSDYLDPEQMTSDANGRVYPFSRTFSFGVDISF